MNAQNVVLSNRQRAILEDLNYGSASNRGLSNRLLAPMASIRRDIQGLRQKGYNILCRRGVYALVPSNASQNNN